MTRFFAKLKVIFDEIPIKARFLKDLDFNISYSGFRYFMQGRRNTTSKKLLDNLCENMGYEYVTIPIKKNDAQQAFKHQLEDSFFSDLNIYLKKYEDDPTRIYSKEFGNESSVAQAIAAFSTDDVFDPDEKVDYSDIF